MYSTWLSVSPRGYCERSFLGPPCELIRGLGGAEPEDCCDEGAAEDALDLELVSDMRSLSIFLGGSGDLCGGKEESDVRRGPEPFVWLLLLYIRFMPGRSAIFAQGRCARDTGSRSWLEQVAYYQPCSLSR